MDSIEEKEKQRYGEQRKRIILQKARIQDLQTNTHFAISACVLYNVPSVPHGIKKGIHGF